MKNQKGFSAVEALLVSVVILMLGGVMYFVYNANQESKTQNNTQSTQNQPKSNVPVGYKEYKNEKFGISFVYPDKYKETTDANLSSEPDTAKDYFSVGFSSTKFGLFVQSSKKDVDGGDGPCLFNVKGFDKKGDKYYYNTDAKTVEGFDRLDNKNGFEVLSPKAVIWNEVSNSEFYAYAEVCSAVNLENSEFQGVGFRLSINNAQDPNQKNSEPVKDVSKEDIKSATDELKAIVKSFKQI